MLLQSIRVSAVAVLAAGAIGTAVLAQQGKGRPADRLQAAGPIVAQTEAQEIRTPEASRDEPSKATIRDQRDGEVTYVDYEAKEVLVAINQGMGARPHMKLTVFVAHAPNSPTGNPKGTIELTSIDEKYSQARIIKTNNSINPIRVGDIVYSPMLTPNPPTRFALMGKIDINRDSYDDRDELKRMIKEAGGVVEFDLPPPGVGEETGVLRPRIDWYVIDARGPLGIDPRNPPRAVPSKPDKRLGEAIKEARLSGIRPMPIERLRACATC
jgi:hypothetical protein